VATARMGRAGMVVLLVLTSPDALSEPLGAGARPVHSIRDISLACNDLSLSGAKQTLASGLQGEFMSSRPCRRHRHSTRHPLAATAEFAMEAQPNYPIDAVWRAWLQLRAWQAGGALLALL
jgi:hypothetical protein